MSNHQLHIGYDVSQTGANKAGCGFFAHSMLNAMMNLAPDKYYSLFPSFGDFFFDARMPIKNPYSRGHYGPRHFNREKARIFWGQDNLEAALGRPDIIHANNFWCPKNLKNSRLIYTFYDLGFAVNPDWSTATNRVGCFSGVFSAAINADFIVAISAASKAHFLSIFPHYPEERVRVIYPSSRFNSEQTVGKKPRTLKNTHKNAYWLNVGTIEPRKNQYGLVEAYARYLDCGGSPMPLVFAGGAGWLMDDFKSSIQKLGIESQVIFTGYVSNSELAWLYQNCYANLYPSWFEGFGLPVLEGMQFGAPSIVSNVSSLPEVAGNAAILLSPNKMEDWTEAMLRLSRDENARYQLSRAAIDQVKMFAWQQSGQELLDVYAEAIDLPKWRQHD